jgi:hypothetical protein
MSILMAVRSETSAALTGHPETALGLCNYKRLGRAEQSIDPSPILPKSGESAIIESISSPPNF